MSPPQVFPELAPPFTDPLLKRAQNEIQSWKQFKGVLKRTVFTDWLLPENRKEATLMQECAILIFDEYAQESGSLGGGLAFLEQQTKDSKGVAVLPDVSGFRPVFESPVSSNARSFGRYRQRRLVYVPLVFLSQRGELILQGAAPHGDLVFEKTPLSSMNGKLGKILRKSGGDAPRSVPDPETIRRLLVRGGYASSRQE